MSVRRGAAREWFLTGALALVALGRLEAGEVRLELRVPEAETWVIGDAIPLVWRFQNQSTQALGFMWEGCCRLNGNVAVWLGDHPLPTTPPGTTLAHMFAKADRLDPGVPREYETRVHDWVALPGTGTYRLRGTYRGVLPTQVPQLERGLALWRDAAGSGSIELRVLEVADYLAQREAREHRRGLRVTIQSPNALPPLVPITVRVTLENPGDRGQSVVWPDEAALWVLDSKGQRRVPAAVIGSATETLSLPPGGRVERTFQLGSDRFEGESFGDYRVFVDLAGTGMERPRVPSNPVPLLWRLDAGQVADLVNSAAAGARTGARNAPLKLLRVYLADLGETLASLDRAALTPAAQALADRLARAARLKPLGPRPGTVELGIAVRPRESRWVLPLVESVVEGAGPDLEAQLDELLGLSRHLGWEMGVLLEPSPDAVVAAVLAVADRFGSRRASLAGPLTALVPIQGTNAPARMVLGAGGSAAGPVLRIEQGGRSWSADGIAFSEIPDDAALGVRGESLGPALALRVEAGREMSWRSLTAALRPLVRPGARFELMAR